MRNTGVDEAQAGIKISGRNINNLRYSNDPTLMAESEEELKSLLMKVKEEWKSWLNVQHSENRDHGTWSHHFMANRWGNSGNSVRLYFWGLQNHYRCWLQPWKEKMLPPWKESMNNLDSILKSRDITLPTNVHPVKGMVFPCMDVRVGLWRKLSTKESMFLNCGVEEDSWELLVIQGDQTSQS